MDDPFEDLLGDLVMTSHGVGYLVRVEDRDPIRFWITVAFPTVSATIRFDDCDEPEWIPWPSGRKGWTVGEISKLNEFIQPILRLGPYVDALRDESDRGAILVGAEILNVVLRKLLLARLVSPGAKAVVGDGRSGDLRRRVNLAAAAGLLPRTVFASLQAIVVLRNEVAHNPLRVSFADRTIQNMAGQLPSWQSLKDTGLSRRVAFELTVGWLTGWLERAAEDVPPLSAPEDVPDDTFSRLHTFHQSAADEAHEVLSRLQRMLDQEDPDTPADDE